MLRDLRRRYLALKLDSEATFDSKEIMDAIWHAVLKLYGEYGASQTHLGLIDYNADEKIVILRTVHTTMGIVRVALASITKIRDKPVAIHVLRVSGTIKALRRKIKRQI